MKRPETAQSEVRAVKRSRRCSLTFSVVAAALFAALLAPTGARAQGDGPGAQILFPVGTNVFVPTWLNMEMNSDLSQSVLRLDADVDADVLLAIYQRGFAIGDRFAEIWVVPMWADLGAQVDVARAGGGIDHPLASASRASAIPTSPSRSGSSALRRSPCAEFMKHKPTFQLYAYGGVYVPIGDYDSDRLLNFGTNRWAYRLGLPMVLPLGDPEAPDESRGPPGLHLLRRQRRSDRRRRRSRSRTRSSRSRATCRPTGTPSGGARSACATARAARRRPTASPTATSRTSSAAR